MKKIFMTFPAQIVRKIAYGFLFVLISSTQLFAQQTDLLKAGDVIKQNAARIGLSENDLKNYRISDAYVDKLSGATIYYLQQTYKDIDVLNAVQTVAIKNNWVVSVAGKRIPGMEIKANIKDAIAAVTPENAIRAMAKHLNLTVSGFIQAIKQMDEKKVVAFGDLGISSIPIKSRLIWLTDSKSKKAFLSWQVTVQPKGVPDYWLVHIDASKGDVLGKMNLNVSCSWSKDGMEPEETAPVDNYINEPSISTEGETGVAAVNSAAYRVIPFPAESPIHPGGTAALVSNPWELAGTGNAATTLKWNDDGTNTYDSTRGNNVLVQEDKDGNNLTKGKGAHSSTMLPDLSFDFTPDYAQQPTVTVNQNFAITNLFYWNNIMHDISYQYGFDEVSGNFQANNQGRGGSGNDYVLADAQDGSSTNNANFATGDDGGIPRMQMYLWTTSTIKKDGDLDNGIVAHEYTHGISTRLTGGPSESTCLQNAEQMGEGWSDYYALMVTTDWKTAAIGDGTKSRTIGTYVLGQSTTGGGIRTYPYSTDININPWTYANIASTGGEVHTVGEIWCTVLWEMTWGMIQMDGINKNIYNANGTGGNSAALKLVTEGMKLQPCSPGFIDGRDAILKADTLLYGGKYSCVIWNAFKKRGMGFYASQGSSLYIGDEKADFVSAILVKTASKDSFVQQEQITYTLKLNSGPCASLSNYKIVDTLPTNVTYISSTGTYTKGNRTVTFSNINLGANNSVTNNVKVTVNNGSYIAPIQHVNEPIAANAIPAGWSIYSSSNNKWQVTTSKNHSAPYAMFIADADSTVLARFTTSAAFALTNNSILSFWHNYNTEATWDGGWIEISTNNGVTYTDLNKYIIQNGYQNTLYYKEFRLGFSGNSNGFIKTVINLSSFAGKSVKFRFVFSSDEAVGGEGWYIDDINLVSESGVQNLGQFFNSNNELVSSSAVYSTITNGTLPVIWGEFTAVKQGNTASLKWQTLQEYNTAHFTIERSADGEHFHQLATIAAAGNSSVAKTYQFIDKLPLNGKGYYRITQVDKDGKFTYSPVRSLEFLLKHVVTITPNPAKDKIAITVSGNDKALKIYIMNATGKQVSSFNMQGQYLQINFPNIAPGIYYIKVTGDAVNHTQKIVIQ